MRTFLAIVLIAFTLTSKAQPVETTINDFSRPVTWDASQTPNVVGYTLIVTTNQLRLGTNGYEPQNIIASASVPGLSLSITNLWPGITNGTYSFFVRAYDTTLLTSLNTSNLVVKVAIRPSPPRNVRIQ